MKYNNLGMIKNLEELEIVTFPYRKYQEYIIAIKPKPNSMNLSICDLVKALGVPRNEYDKSLPAIKAFGDELGKRFNKFNKLLEFIEGRVIGENGCCCDSLQDDCLYCTAKELIENIKINGG